MITVRMNRASTPVALETDSMLLFIDAISEAESCVWPIVEQEDCMVPRFKVNASANATHLSAEGQPAAVLPSPVN